MVYARHADDKLAGLVSKIDTLVAEHQDEQLASLVVFVGPEAEPLKAAVKQFGEKHGFQNVVLAVPQDHEFGHRGLKLNPEAEITVMIYKGKQIQANLAAPVDGVGDAFTARMTEAAQKVLR